MGRNGYSHFQSFAWAYLYSTICYKECGDLRVYLLYRDNELIAIAPFAIKKRGLISEYYCFYENTQADYLDLIYDKLEQYELEYLINKIYETEALCCIRLRKLLEDSHTFFMLQQSKVLKSIEVGREKCIQIRMDDDVKEYSQRLGKSTKREIRSMDNRIHKEFTNVHVDFIYDKMYASDLLEKLMTIYRQRRIHKFGSETKKAEYYEFIRAYILKSKNSFTSLLRLNGEIAAFNIGFFSNNKKLEILITSFDSQYHRYEVGNYLLYHSVCGLIERGVKYGKNIMHYDLGWGEELYKIKYGGEIKHIMELLICKNDIYYYYQKAYIAIRSYLKRIARTIRLFKENRKRRKQERPEPAAAVGRGRRAKGACMLSRRAGAP